MKKNLLLALSIAILLLTAGCGEDDQPQNTPPNNKDDIAVVTPAVTPEDDDAEEGDQEPELDEDAPEYITRDSISDTVPVPLYCTLTVDGKDTDFECGKINFPAQLYVEETLELHAKGQTDLNEDDLMVKDYFQDGEKRYVFVEADGTLPATRPATTHVLSVEVIFDTEPYTLESLTEDNEGWTVTELTVDGVAAYVLRPDTEQYDSGFASTLFRINAGASDHAYGTAYCCMDIDYQGGLLDYAEADFDEITSALLELITVDFKPAE